MSDGEDATFAQGVALLHAGEAFEAHEAWEALWRAAKVRHDDVDERLLRGLIHVAAAVVKHQRGSAPGVAAHLRSAVELFEALRGAEPARLRGVDVEAMLASLGAAQREGERVPTLRVLTPRSPRPS